MGGLFSGPPRLPPSNPQGEDFSASPLVTDRFDLASAESATPLPPPSPPRAPLIPVADEALTRRPGRQSTVLSMLEPPDAGGAAPMPLPSPSASPSRRGYVQLAANTTTAKDAYEVAEDNTGASPPARLGTLTLSPSGADFIKSYEKPRDQSGRPYGSVEGGNPTIGWGHKITDQELKDNRFAIPLTPKEADELFRRDVASAERDVNRLVKIPLTQAQFDALVSLRYNLPPSLFKSSRALSYLNAGDFERAFQEWAEFRLAGRPLQRREHLEKRRAAEIEMFRRGMGKN